MAADEIRQIVEQVLKSFDIAALLGTADARAQAAPSRALGCGVFPDVDGAVKAAAAAQRELIALPLVYHRQPHRGRNHAGPYIHAGAAVHAGGLFQDHIGGMQ